MAEQLGNSRSLLWDQAAGRDQDERFARLMQTGARRSACGTRVCVPGSSWGSTPGLERPVWLFQGSCIPQPSLYTGFHRKQQQPSSAVLGLGQCALDKWAFCPQLHRGQALPNLQVFCFPFFFFFSLAKSIYGQLTHFPPLQTY